MFLLPAYFLFFSILFSVFFSVWLGKTFFAFLSIVIGVFLFLVSLFIYIFRTNLFRHKLWNFFNSLKKLKSIFNYLTFKNIFVVLLVFISVFLLLEFFISPILCQRPPALYVHPTPGATDYLGLFYIHEKSPEDNLLRQCFAEAVSVIYAHGAFQKSAGQNLPLDLKRVIGRQCLEMAEEFAQRLMKKDGSPSKVNLFLTNMFKKPVDSLYLYEIYNDFLIGFTDEYGLEWYENNSLSDEVEYFLSIYPQEELSPLLLGSRTDNKYHNLANFLRYFSSFEEKGLYFFVYTDEGRTTLKTFFDALARENPNGDYNYFFKTLEPNYKIKAKDFLQLLYNISWEYEENILTFFSKIDDLYVDNFGAGVKFIDSYYNFCVMHPIYEQVVKEIGPAQKMVYILYYPGNSAGSEYSLSVLSLIEKRLILNKEKGFYENDDDYVRSLNNLYKVLFPRSAFDRYLPWPDNHEYLKNLIGDKVFVYADVIFGDIRICRTVDRYLRWIGNAGYIKDKDTFLLYQHHARIVLDLLVAGEEFAEEYKLTFDEIMLSVNFVKHIVETVELEDKYLARKVFGGPTIRTISFKKRM